MNCEARYHGDEYCPRDANAWIFTEVPVVGGEKALCYKHLAEQLMQYGAERKIKWIETIGKKQVFSV